MADAHRILYCHCSYAQVVPRETKEAVLRQLCDSGVAFEAVGDLCEMSARRDAALQRLSAGGDLKIVACFPRAVKWLFAATKNPLPPSTEVINMRTMSVEEISAALARVECQPNLPANKTEQNGV